MEKRLPAGAWTIVGLLWVVVSLNFINRVMLTTMHDSLSSSFQLTETQFGLLTAVFLWTYGLASPLAGFIADRFGRSRAIILSLFVWSLLTAVTVEVRNFHQLLILRATVGACEACYLPASLALIAGYHPGPTRSLATGINLTGMIIGSMIGGYAGRAAELYSWKAVVLWVGLAGVAYCVPLLVTLRDVPVMQREEVEQAGSPTPLWAALAELFRRNTFIGLMVYWALLGAASWMINGWTPVFLQETFHISQGRAGSAAHNYPSVAALAGMVLGGAWADKWSQHNSRGRLFVPAIGLWAMVPCMFLITHGSTLGVAVLGIVVFGITSGLTNSNMMPILCMSCGPQYRATAYGIINMAATIAGGLGVYVTGLLKDSGVSLGSILGLDKYLFAAGGIILVAMARRVPAIGSAAQPALRKPC